MTTKNKGRTSGTAHKNNYDRTDYIKPSRISRKHKRGWKGARK